MSAPSILFRLVLCLVIVVAAGCGRANGRVPDNGGGKGGGSGGDGGTVGARPGGSPQQPTPARPSRRAVTREEKIRKAYFALEVAPGSDVETVRDSYQRLMTKYDPNRYVASPDKHRAAIELTRRLTEAYEFLDRQLGGSSLAP